MEEPTWQEAVDIVNKHVVNIWTPQGSGTGFLVSVSKSTTICAVATAAHVIDYAYHREEPICIVCGDSGQGLFLRHPDRSIIIDEIKDIAAIIFNRGGLTLPIDSLPLVDRDKKLRVGVEIGWLGYPAIPTAGLCFFTGRISAWLDKEQAYLVDGVAINGVSGGPAFTIWGGMLAGVVEAYIPNRITGEALPGLAVVREIKQFHGIADSFRTFDEAKAIETPITETPMTFKE